MFEELGEEPGPLYEEYASFYFYIDSIDNASLYFDSYIAQMSGYLCTGDSSISIKDTDSRSVEYYKYENDTDLVPKYVVDFYLYNSSSSGDLQYEGVAEMIITKYTDLGVKFFSM